MGENFETKKEARTEGKYYQERMKGKGWVLRVWYNLGWHWSLQNGYISLYPCGEDFHVLIGEVLGEGAGCMVWHGNRSHRDPNKAVENEVKAVRRAVEKFDKILERCEQAISG